MGTVEESVELSSWRVAVGFGIRLTVEFFGPIPIELDFAAPVVRDADDQERVFSFFIGGSF
jgi:outer membrane protein assembly factor BamA